METGTPTGIRTPVAAVKGQCPRPLDDGRMRERARIIPIQKALSSVGRERAVLNLHGCGHLGFADTIFTLYSLGFHFIEAHVFR